MPISAVAVAGLVSVVTIFQLLQQYAYHLANGFDFDFSWRIISAKLLIGNLLWAGLSPLLLSLARSLTTFNRLSSKNLIQLVLVLAIAFLHNLSSLWLYNFSYYLQSGYMRSFFGDNNRSDLITGFFTSLIECVVIIGLFMAVDYQRKLANKERDLAKAQLDALKMQLHPHFIFNTLHSISSMIDMDMKKAQRMITKVGDLLRSMLAYDEIEFVTLKEEIDFIRNYLELEQIRFQDRMSISFDIDDRLAQNKVPSLILQPLVENCIKHGVSKSTGQSHILVSATICQNGTNHQWLKLEINNSESNRAYLSHGNGFGIGLQNVKKRLAQNYPEQYFCEFGRVDDKHYKSEIRIPIKT
ncbi:Histidine kinase [Reichenbachiella faecimaris]|uniref:Histidine kinase n=1 Tax=Reichenbachiella faecimaris TaxID=692418 RepID=A0A1W2G4W8_REIFA|nr:Histidine kinase [Reichenbachiella faecimaris]